MVSIHEISSPMTTTEDVKQESIARDHQRLGRFAEAEALLRTVLSTRSSTLDNYHPDVIRAKNNLAACLNAQHKDLTYAETLQLEVVAADRELQGAEHPDVLSGLNNLAGIHAHQGRYGKAIKIQREILAMNAKIHGSEHESALDFKENLGNSLVKYEQMLVREVGQVGKSDEGERIYRNFLAKQDLNSLARVSATASLGDTLRERGDSTEANSVYGEALDLANDIADMLSKKIIDIQNKLQEMKSAGEG